MSVSVKPTTPTEAIVWLNGLPESEQTAARAALECLWEDGFLVGAGGLPRRNPMLRDVRPVDSKKKR